MLRRLRGWLGRRTSTQLAAGMAVLAAAALAGSLLVTGAAVRADQRQQAALAALDDYSALAEKLGSEAALSASSLTEADAAFLSAYLAAFQSGPERDARTIEQTCRTGRGGSGVRFIRAPVGKPAGLVALETARGERARRLGDGVWVLNLRRGDLCPSRAVEVVAVKRRIGALDLIVGRVVEPSGAAWGLAAAVLIGVAVLLAAIGLTAATFARRRLTGAVAEVSRALDRAAVGDFSIRAPETALAPELTELTGHVNGTLDRLEELVRWMRDSADQMAHDFRTPLARASARLEQMKDADDNPETRALADEARRDLARLSRAMTEAMALRDGEAWTFESVRLDVLIQQTCELYEPLAEERGVAFRVEAAPVAVLGVHSLLQRALANLVDNALKYSPPGGVITLTVADDADGARVTVADQGPGFDASVLDDPSAAVAASQSQGRESHGMGLAFVQAILRRHGAAMTIDDARPGAVVTARFPR
ncbi:sensor histidine kinase [Brevundimonas sp. NPDC092305]|uniref:sensor histidine kinase n=1 Tax=Brevundimonas sp. NPDC092305 TaxID=3363957 RepID=UPI0037FE47C5